MNRFIKLAVAATVAVVCWVQTAVAQVEAVQVWNSGSTVVSLYEVTGVLTVTGTGAMANYAGTGNVPWYNDRTLITSVVIEDGVTAIGTRAFIGSTNLTTVVISNSVTSIGSMAFYNCARLGSVTIPNSVTSIGSEAFRDCINLTSVTLFENLASIGTQAFQNCQRLASITIPNSVTTMGTSVFQACTSLTTAVIGNGVTSIGTSTFSGNRKLTSVTIGSSVVSIGTSAFQGCSSLVTVNIPGGVTSIGDNAFQGCTNLASIDIPNSVISIGNGAFRGSGLTSIILPENLTAIGNNMFSGCANLISVTFPPNLTSIGNSAFAGSGLISVTIPNSVTNVGSNAFNDSRNLTSVVIGSGVTELNHWHFTGCTSLTSIEAVSENAVYSSIDGVLFNKDKTTLVLFPQGKQDIYTIPDGTTSTGQYSFWGCGLTAVIIPESVTSLGGGGIFGGCNSLTSITSLNPIPPTIGGDPHGLNQGDVDLYVPVGSISAYSQAQWWGGNEWSKFKSINPIPTTSILSTDRKIPGVQPSENIAVVVPANVLTGEFTAGPNPVARSSGIVNFYRQGRRINDGTLTIFDASGNVVNTISISDCRGGPTCPPISADQPKHHVATWDLRDSRGRPVPEGTYLIRGVLTTIDGKRERVSVVVGVR